MGEVIKTAQQWVDETIEAFLNVETEPSNPVKAIEAYFERTASDALKEQVKAEGKTAGGCWKFVMKVATKYLKNRSRHIDPNVVYAIAMHWFQDVPKDWDKVEGKTEHKTATAPSEAAKPAETAKASKNDEKPKKAKKKKKTCEQGFFFDMLGNGGEDAKADSDEETAS